MAGEQGIYRVVLTYGPFATLEEAQRFETSVLARSDFLGRAEKSGVYDDTTPQRKRVIRED